MTREEMCREVTRAAMDDQGEDQRENEMKTNREGNMKSLKIVTDVSAEEKRERENKQQREWGLRRRYGLTPEQRDAMLAAQGGGCAVCGTTRTGKYGFHVDHDHKTGRVRGILCRDCNLVLGNMHDDPAILRALADYIEHWDDQVAQIRVTS